MSALLETLLTALILSGLAAICLALLPNAPPRLRFAVAAVGLAAWLVPWGSIRVALPSTAIAAPFASPLADSLLTVAELESLTLGRSLDAATLLGCWLAAASLVGLALFVGDCLALRPSLRRWRCASRPADELRSLLPAELARVAAEIRVVTNSSVAAASGYFRPTIWIGDRYTGERLRLVVLHEMWHVRGHDPLWLLLVAAVRRAYWWNPLVAHLARQATLMIESTCDHRSAQHFDKPRYVAVVAALGAGAAATATTNVIELETVVALEASPSSVNNEVLDELLSSYAYTPQQHLGNAP
jgi:beta-lactamase regulating signal transducer with metallopeptidase domain